MTAPQPPVPWQPPGPAHPPSRARLGVDAVLALVVCGVAVVAALLALLLQQFLPLLMDALDVGHRTVGAFSTVASVVVILLGAAAAVLGLVVVLRAMRAAAPDGRDLVVGAIVLGGGVMLVVPRFVGVMASLAFAWLS